jgi:hypothetical protein
MNFRSIVTSLVLAALSATLTGCGSDTRVTNTSQTSVGQQLLDLEQARNQGIITEKEYNRLKKAVIKNND